MSCLFVPLARIIAIYIYIRGGLETTSQWFLILRFDRRIVFKRESFRDLTARCYLSMYAHAACAFATTTYYLEIGFGVGWDMSREGINARRKAAIYIF